jgi:hypothetical protein
MDLQCRRAAGLRPKRNPGLPREFGDEPLDLFVECSVVGASDGDGERLVDRKLPSSPLNAGGHGHQAKLRLSLGNSEGCENKKYANTQ